MSHWRALRFDFSAMASPCSLELHGRDERALRRAAREAIAEVQRIERKFSRYRADSMVSRINAAAGGPAVALDAETAALLDFGAQLWQTSGGRFDLTSGVLRQVWDFKNARIPSPDELAATLTRVGWAQVQRSRAGIRLPLAGMELDLGGIGKEYAADRAAALLSAHGVRHALVNLGGDLHALGPQGLPAQAGQAWPVDIAHPRLRLGNEPARLARWPLAHGGLATSGDYERYFEHAGQRYCHVLDARTGQPVRHWQAISVAAPTCAAAGAACTLAMLLQEQALDWLATQQLDYLAVRHDGARFTSNATFTAETQELTA